MIKNIQFLGASSEVTGSSYLLTTKSGETMLVDLGMFQGNGHTHEANFSPLSFDPSKLSGVLLTHAHIDHCGRLPLLVKQGFTGKIYSTEATKQIAHVALLDSAKVSAEENGMSLYTDEDVEQTISCFETYAYDETFALGAYDIIFRDAGHILGAASIEIRDENKKVIAFSGDLGNSPQDLIRPTKSIQKADIVIMESTYGDRVHADHDASITLQSEINAIESENSVLLIPAFSIQRTQELLHKIGHLKLAGRIKMDTPIYLDGPMGISVTHIFKKFPQLYNEELSSDKSPFDFPGLVLTPTRDESKNINNTEGAKVIIAGSGMMSGGRIMYHLKDYLPLPSTRLLVVGYQAAGTLGRAIEDGAKRVNIHDHVVVVNAKITRIESLSAHADQPKLLRWVQSINGIQQLFLVHGDDIPRTTFAQKVQNELGIKNIVLPSKNQICELA